MLISISLAVYNSSAFLCETIDSILAQTFEDFEFIIVDDISTDKSLEICKSYNDKRIRIFKNETKLGPYNTHEKTFQLGTGKYCFFAGHDDLIAPNYLEVLVAELEKDDNLVLSFTDIYEMYSVSNFKVHVPIQTKLLNLHKLNSSSDSLYIAKEYMLMPESSGKANLFHSLIRRSAIDKTGSFFSLYSSGWGDDYLHIFRLILEGRIKYIPDSFFVKRVVGKNRWNNSQLPKLHSDYLNAYFTIINNSNLTDDKKKYLLQYAEIKRKQGVK